MTTTGLRLLGRNYSKYGEVNSFGVGQHSAMAISVGSDRRSPSIQFKASFKSPNEDAVCLVEGISDDDNFGWVGMAVADAHFGIESSHELIERLFLAWTNTRPQGPEHLAEMLASLADPHDSETSSESTLLAVVYERRTKTGYGISFGDSSFAIGGMDRDPAIINEHDDRYVSSSEDAAPIDGKPFTFSASPEETLMVFTDGVNECHYRHPETSVRPRDIAEALAKHSQSPEPFVTELSSVALAGVRGNPGGQDNIAIAATLS